MVKIDEYHASIFITWFFLSFGNDWKRLVRAARENLTLRTNDAKTWFEFSDREMCSQSADFTENRQVDWLGPSSSIMDIRPKACSFSLLLFFYYYFLLLFWTGAYSAISWSKYLKRWISISVSFQLIALWA